MARKIDLGLQVVSPAALHVPKLVMYFTKKCWSFMGQFESGKSE